MCNNTISARDRAEENLRRANSIHSNGTAEFVAMQVTADKIMFEIYKDSTQEDKYKVVYFTELDEHSKQTEINSAMRGEHVYDGFIRYDSRDQGKRAVNLILRRLNSGEALDPQEIERELKSFMA